MMSGKGVLPIGLKCVRQIREAVDCPIIGCGGVSSADDVRAFLDAGATVVGVGSALIGLTTDEQAMFDYSAEAVRGLVGKLVAMEAYVTYERRGVALDPGKH